MCILRAALIADRPEGLLPFVVLEEDEGVEGAARNLLGFEPELVQRVDLLGPVDTVLSNVAQTEAVIFVVAPTPEMAGGVDGHCRVETDVQGLVDEAGRGIFDLFELTTLHDLIVLSEQPFLTFTRRVDGLGPRFVLELQESHWMLWAGRSPRSLGFGSLGQSQLDGLLRVLPDGLEESVSARPDIAALCDEKGEGRSRGQVDDLFFLLFLSPELPLGVGALALVVREMILLGSSFVPNRVVLQDEHNGLRCHGNQPHFLFE